MSIFARNTTVSEFAKERPVTSFLIITNTVMLIYIMFSGGFGILNLYALGAIHGPTVKDGEYYRIITAAFLHGGVLHYVSNMVIGMSFLGAALEKTIGSVKYAVIFFLAVIGSGVLVVFTSEAVTIGASGGIFGLLGALLYISINRTDLLTDTDRQRIWTLTGIQVFFTFVGSNISIAGHIGGLITGFLICFLILGSAKEPEYDIYY